jgi:hypothetical protein
MRINVIKADGTIGSVEDSELTDAINQGVVKRKATDQDMAPLIEQRKYGTPIEQLKTGLEAAASGATFGLSRKAEEMMGVEPEVMAARARANPTTAAVGEVAGTIAPLLVPQIGLGKLAMGLPAAMAARGATTLGETAAGALGGGRLARIAGSAISGAAEGAAIAAGEQISENTMLGPDHELNAEQLIAAMGTGALAGGAIGGAAKILGEGLSAATGKLASVTDTAAIELLRQRKAYQAMGEGTLGVREAERAKKLWGPAYQEKIGKIVLDNDVLQGLKNDADDILVRIRAKLPTYAKQIGESLEKADEMAPMFRPSREELADELETRILKPLENSEFSKKKRLAADIREELKPFLTTDEMVPRGPWGFADLHAKRHELDELIDYERGNLDVSLKKMLSGARRIIEKRLEDSADAAANSLGEEFATTYRTAKNNYHGLKTAESVAARRETRNETQQALGIMGPLAGATVGGVISGEPIGALIGFGASAVQQQASVLIKKYGASAIAVGLEGIGEKIGALSKSIDGSVARMFSTELTAPIAARGAFQSSLAERFEEKKEQYAHANDQTVNKTVFDRLADAGIPPSQAPNLAAALVATTSRGVSYIRATQPGIRGPREDNLFASISPPRVSAADQKRWLDIISAVEDPKSVIEAIGDGSATITQVNAVKTVYPKLTGQMQNAALRAATNVDRLPSMNAQRQFSQLLGKPVTPYQSGMFVLAAQKAIGMGEPRAQPVQKRNRARIATSDFEDRNMSRSEQLIR